MQLNIASCFRSIISLARYALPLSFLLFTACGGGGGSGGGGGGVVGLRVSTLAGTANPGADGTGAAARFLSPGSAVSDGGNYLYVTDTANDTIRRIDLSTRAVTTLAGKVGIAGSADGFGTSATFRSPAGIAIDSTHTYLYVVDSGNNKIRQIVISNGAVSSLTGTADMQVAVGAADGAAASASFNNPHGITSDGTTLYVADTGNNKIRTVVISTGVVGSLTGAAGTTVASGAADNTNATLVSFNAPSGITIDSTSTTLYVADTGNNKIRSVLISSGATSSVTGSPNTQVTAGATDSTTASSASFTSPFGITNAGTNLYVADTGNNKIRKVVIGGAVTSLTGTASTIETAGYADGGATVAAFYNPDGITVAAGKLYVADTRNNTLRQIVLSGVTVSTLAGSASLNIGADGTGAVARFVMPAGVVSDGTNLYVADSNNDTIRKIVIATGAVTTLAGQAGVTGVADGTGTAATFSQPWGITTDGLSLYVADTGNNKIRKITPSTGTLSGMTSATAAVTSMTGYSNIIGAAGATDNPSAASVTFKGPKGICTDGINLYVADTGNNKIRKIVISSGAVSSLTGAASTTVASGAADDPTAANVSFNAPTGITVDGSNTNLYVADTGNNKIRQVVIAGGATSSFTGAANVSVAAGAKDSTTAALASFSAPSGIASDGINLYVADAGNNKIRKVVISTGAVSSLTGATNTAGTPGYADGAILTATFSGPSGIASVGSSLFVSDQSNSTIRKIQ